MLIQHENLRAALRAILAAAGSTGEEPDIVADHLVEANLKGHDSHGVGMLPRYIGLVQRGLLFPNRHAGTVRDDGPLLVLDGGHGYGQVIAREATAMAIGRARTHGVALLALRNSNHVGRVGTYGEQCAAAGLISLHFVNVTGRVPLVAPFGGSDARLATNPFTCAIPTSDPEAPIVLDMATSAVAQGKVRVAKNLGVAMAPGLLIDSEGNPATDPNVMFADPPGAIRAFGLHKGSGLALICDLLAGALGGGGTMQPGTPRRNTIVNGMLAVVIDPARLGDQAFIVPEIDAMIAYVKGSPPADPAAPVLVPGEPERQCRAERLKSGLPIDERTWEEILAAGDSVGFGRDDIRRICA